MWCYVLGSVSVLGCFFLRSESGCGGWGNLKLRSTLDTLSQLLLNYRVHTSLPQ